MRNIVSSTPRRCDAHHHLFASGTASFDGAAYPVEAFGRDVATVPGVAAAVHVQARNAYDDTAGPELAPVGETRWLAGLHWPDDVAVRCVGFADLGLGAAVGPVVDAHREAAPRLFAGVRHSAAWSDDPALRPFAGSLARPGVLGEQSFSLGIAEVHLRGLPFETWVFADQLDDLRTLAAAHDDGLVVVDHLGGPYDAGTSREDVLAGWRTSMSALAGLEHVVVKISGIGMAALTPPGRVNADAEAIAAHWGPAVRWCIDTFGAHRCLLGTDFPVDRMLCDYATLWAALDLMIADRTADEQDRLRYGTAARVYGL